LDLLACVSGIEWYISFSWMLVLDALDFNERDEVVLV